MSDFDVSLDSRQHPHIASLSWQTDPRHHIWENTHMWKSTYQIILQIQFVIELLTFFKNLFFNLKPVAASKLLDFIKFD